MPLAALAWRGLAARPLRTLLTVAGIALGVAIMTATLVAGGSARVAVESAAQEVMGRADLRVRAFREEGFTPRTVQALRGLPGVETGTPVSERRLVASTEPGPNEQVFTLLVLGVDPVTDASVRDHSLAAGSFLEASSETDALVPAAWASDRGLGLGDRLLLTGRRAGVPGLRIVGLLEDAGLGALNEGAVLVMARDALDAAFEIPAPVRHVDLVVADGQLEAVRAALEATLREPFVLETAADAADRFARAQAGFGAIAFVLGVVAVAVGGFLAANAMAITVVERSREIGLLRGAGATRGQVLAVFGLQATLLAAAGSMLGSALGIGAAWALVGFLAETRGMLVSGLPLRVDDLALAAGIGFAVAIAATGVSAHRASRVGPLAALRPSSLPDRGLRHRLPWLGGVVAVAGLLAVVLLPNRPDDLSPGPILAAGAIVLGATFAGALLLAPLGALLGRPLGWFFGAHGALARLPLARDTARTGLAVSGLAIALAAAVAVGAASESARAGAERWVASVLPGGHGIRLGLPVAPDLLRPALQATSGVRATTPIVELPAVLDPTGERREVGVAGIDPTVFQDAGSLLVVDGHRAAAFNALRQGGAILVPEQIATAEGLVRGDVLGIAAPGGGEQQLTVGGIVAYSLPGPVGDGALLVSLADAAERFGTTAAALWALVPQDGVPPSAFAAAVRDTAAQLAGEPVTPQSLAGDLARSLDRLMGLFAALALVAVLIAGLGILVTLSAGVAERSRELLILRASGMTVSQVQAMVVTEAAIIGAVASVLAVATGLGVAWALLDLGAPSDFAAGLAVPWPLVVAVVLLGTGVAALAGAYPARVAGNLSMAEHLKHYE